jgi:hypothetical protein
MKRKILLGLFILLPALVFPADGRLLETKTANPPPQDRESLVSLLPEGVDLSGWKSSSSPRFYEPANLWEYINGQSELYLNYGFQMVMTSDYVSEDPSRSLNIEIFKMENPDDAFGIYAAERNSEDEFLKIGVQGYFAENTVNFWDGPYYVKLLSFENFPNLKETLLKLANSIAAKIEGEYSEPKLFACFPEKNKVRMSERYIPANFLGHSFLKNGHRVEYENKGIRYSLFLAESRTPQEAEEAFTKYENFLKSENATIVRETKPDYREMSVKNQTSSVIFQYTTIIGGVQNIVDLPEGKEIVLEMLNKLRGRGSFPH